MSNQSHTIEGKVLATERNLFKVETDFGIVKATLSGKIRKNKIRIVVGDTVDVEVSAYDIERGRIVKRK